MGIAILLLATGSLSTRIRFEDELQRVELVGHEMQLEARWKQAAARAK